MERIYIENIIYLTYWELNKANALKRKWKPSNVGSSNFMPEEMKAIADSIINKNPTFR